ncbi:hypothetical protein [Frankia sp. AgB32]|nr:hypothetical protein [Frankia sp. AgB32]
MPDRLRRARRRVGDAARGLGRLLADVVDDVLDVIEALITR